ncbi:MAG: alpha-hydroxy-acid oxidizing protein [Bacteroidetes bacterium]|nr:alpha-hydroxy-acid oxidizing protein [Bacteroidota bacterium]
MATLSYHSHYPSVDDLRQKAMKRIPRFVFDYLDGGCNEDVNLNKNTHELRDVELMPKYLTPWQGANLKTELFGHTYDAPFGVAPIGLQGLIWPNAPEILAKAAVQHNIPFILSTVSTSSLEHISKITEGKAWYQLYYPAEDRLRDDIMRRLQQSGYDVLVLLCDVPTLGFRPRDIRNGLTMPPKMSLRNILQILSKPAWAIRTLQYGRPQFATLKPYMPKKINMKQLGAMMNSTFNGRLDESKIALMREKWKGKLILKGVATEADAELAIKLGFDGLIISNHGGRQIDVGQSSIHSLQAIHKKCQGKIKIMMDSGLRSGPDIARALASGAEFTFLGRSFMYAVAALGNAGGNHAISILKTQLQQVMEQIGCEQIKNLPEHLVTE